MGTICAPNYENIFMGKFERNFKYQIFIVDLLMISIYSGMEAKHNY